MVTSIQDVAPSSTFLLTGIPGLDQTLGGGLLHGNSVLLQGTPGAGKTAMGMQIIANGIQRYGEPGIFVSFEQFPQQLYRDAASFGWNFQKMESERRLRVVFIRKDDLYSSFPEKESDAITLITDAAIDLHAKRVLVDSASMFWRLPLPPEDQRKLFFEFVMKLKGLGLTPILTSELQASNDEFAPEEFAVDTILKLEHSRPIQFGGERMRTVEVVKARAQNVMEGKHPLRIEPTGLRVSPYIHIASSEDNGRGTVYGQTLSFGLPDFDELLGGGIEAGSTTMVAGMTGTGKTTLGAHFIAAGLETGEPGIFLSLSERPGQLIANMERRGLPFGEAAAEGRLVVMHATGAALQLMEFYYQMQELIQSTNAKRIVVDGLRDFLCTASTGHESNYYLTIYRELFRNCGVTAMFTWTIQDVTGLSSLASIPHSAMMDSIIYIGLLELDSKLRKVVALFKSRGHCADPALRELIITPSEMKVSQLFYGISGILKGSASGRLTDSSREILEPLVHIRDFVNTAEVKTPEQAELVLNNVRKEFDVLAEKLALIFRFRADDARAANLTPKP